MKLVRPTTSITMSLLLIALSHLFLSGVARAEDPPPKIPEGYILIEGDMLIPEEYFDTNGVRLESAFTTNLWPNSVVPFEFDSAVSAANRNRMLAAMNEWERVANVDFRPRGTGDQHWVLIQNSTENNSMVGRQPLNAQPQVINIFNWNWRFIMAHELAHTLGMYHEQSRPDRNSYVIVNTGNVTPTSAITNNFNTVPTADVYPKSPYGLGNGGIGTIVRNGDFESGTASWSQSSTNGRTLIQTSGAARTGDYLAELGVVDNETSALSQTITIPDDPSVFLQHHYWIASSDTCGSDSAEVRLNSTVIATYDLCTDNNTTRWTIDTVDLGGYAGKTVTLNFHVNNDASNPSTFFLEDVLVDTVHKTYDFDSVMHYGQYSFSRCNPGAGCTGTPLPTMEIDTSVPNRSFWQNNIGQRTHLSKLDKLTMSFLYPEANWRFVDVHDTTSTENGTFLEPYRTLNGGVNGVPAAGTLWIQPGTYSLQNGVLDKHMTIRAPLGNVKITKP